MKKLILGIFIFTFSINALNAQVALAKLKFEDAEQAYNNGNYSTALIKLNDAEKLFGKINPPILHLRILVQDKLIRSAEEDFSILLNLKKDCNQFLKEYAEVDGLEEKYKDVYKVSEKYLVFPSSQAELEKLIEKKKKEKLEKLGLFKKVLEDYLEAIGGESAIRSIKTFSYTFEMVSKPSRISIIKSLQEVGKLETGVQFFTETEINAKPYKLFLNNLGGYEQNGKSVRKNLSANFIKAHIDLLYPIRELYQLDNLTENMEVADTSYNGEECYRLTEKRPYYSSTIFYSKKTKLAICEIVHFSAPEETSEPVTIEIISYTIVEGLKFPERIKRITSQNSSIIEYSKYKINPTFKPKDFEN